MGMYNRYQEFVLDVTSENSKDLNCLIQNLKDVGSDQSDDKIPHLLTAALGLCGEAAELMKLIEFNVDYDREKAIDEAGDVLWYIVQGCYALNFSLFNVIESAKRHIIDSESDTFISELQIKCGEFADIVKKVTLHGKSFTSKRDDLQNKLIDITACLLTELDFTDISIENVMQMNIEKLSARHATGFNKDYKSDSQDG